MVRQAISSVVSTPVFIQTLAAPQQLPFPHPPNSSLAFLKVPLERAFSHLAPMVPGAGVVCPLRSFSMVSSLVFLAEMAASRVALYLSKALVWHDWMVEANAFWALSNSPSAVATAPM